MVKIHPIDDRQQPQVLVDRLGLLMALLQLLVEPVQCVVLIWFDCFVNNNNTTLPQ
jgi:hypothetical protein